MAQPLHLLIAEDNPADAELCLRELRRSGFVVSWRRVDCAVDFERELHAGLDLVLSDFEMQGFDGLKAMELLRKSGLDIPLIIVSGTIGEEVAVEAMKLGASDYLMKDRLTRLGVAVSHALAANRQRRESRRIEEELRLFRTLVDQSSDTLEIIDPETGRILDVNGKGPAELGCTRAEYLARRVFEIDSTLTAETWPLLAAKIREAGALNGEGVHRRKDGTTFAIEFSAKWVELDRNYIVTVVRDISVRRQAERALRESEERFRQLAENIQEVFWMSDVAKDRILYVSPNFAKIWGRSCEELYLNPRAWLESIQPEDRERVVQAAKTRQVAGDYDETYRIVRPDGTIRWVQDKAFPVRGADGAVVRVVGVAEDITERKNLEEQFLRAQRQEAIGTLASGIAHDLNNILAPVLMVPPLLRLKLTDARDVQLLSMVEGAAQRGANIIKQLLTFSRGIAGNRGAVQVRHLLKEMVAIMRETFPRDIIVEAHLPADLRPVLADATQIHQVLMNLCVNARDAMRGGGKLTLSAQNAELTAAHVVCHPPTRPGPFVRLMISDTGEGIAAENLDRIFEPFFTTKEVGKGTGLGLSTVLGIVRSHHGFVTVKSERGAGSTFSVHLPTVDETAPGAGAMGEPALPRGEGEGVLLVDDEESIRVASGLLLERQGFRVYPARNGEHALGVYEEHRHDVKVVLIDLMMPVMGGCLAVRALRREAPDLKIVAMSGNVPPELRAELTALGVEHILLKPFVPEEMVATMTKVLAKR